MACPARALSRFGSGLGGSCRQFLGCSRSLPLVRNASRFTPPHNHIADEAGKTSRPESWNLPSPVEIESSEYSTPPLPPYIPRENEPLDVKISRLYYQSRKRGMLENGLLLSTFADEYLEKLTPEQLSVYDLLINLPSNDWDIYYWISGVKPVPEEFQTDVMAMLQDFVQNRGKHSRIRQPDLKER
ncbi:hypothetical protein RvY_15654 [Ramazzottius varieornatus]|uniref:Succinate dehydrogenase assembly factor 2, mitochondrial n=1 Tax=Ramazzottius varieornatus TaxID=947166 RepID=A0A1D1VX83_RAMVA|nr:hypothetical protein RvY_15654 [Ramazzottius varieornatus]